MTSDDVAQSTDTTESAVSTVPPDLKVDLQETKSTERRLSVEVPSGRVEEEIEDHYRSYSRKANVPGFRKGKVPREILRARFGPAIEQEALDDLITKAYKEILAERGLHPVSEATLEEVKRTEEGTLKFSLLFEVVPKPELAPYRGLLLYKRLHHVTPQDVEGVLARLRDEKATFAPVDRPGVRGDQLLVDLLPKDAQGKPDPARKMASVPIELGSEGLLPGFNEALEGRSPGQEAEVVVAYPPDFRQPDLAGKTVAYQAFVHEVKEKHLPPLDDDLAKDLGAGSLEALRTKLENDMKAEMERRAQADLEAQAIGLVIKDNPLEVPESMLKGFLESIAQDLKQRLPPERYDEAKVKEENREQALWLIRRTLLVEEIARRESLAPTEEEVRERVERYAALAPAQAEAIRASYARAKNRRRLQDDLREEKVLAFLVANAQVKSELEMPGPRILAPGEESKIVKPWDAKKK